MPKRKKRGNSKASGGSLTRSISLLRSEVKLGNQELHTRLSDLRDEMRTGFEQVCRYIDEFVKLHETLDIERRTRVERLEAS